MLWGRVSAYGRASDEYGSLGSMAFWSQSGLNET
jgi:hypothetical protein